MGFGAPRKKAGRRPRLMVLDEGGGSHMPCIAVQFSRTGRPAPQRRTSSQGAMRSSDDDIAMQGTCNVSANPHRWEMPVAVIETWTAELACRLQDAVRDTNAEWATRLGVAVRTVAYWRANPAVEPRKEMQRILDTALMRATPEARARFEGAPAPTAQALRVAIAIVTRNATVLLVRRREDPAGLTWQFPAGVIKPCCDALQVAVAETLGETGVHTAPVRRLGSRVHPRTGVQCDYVLCEYLTGDAANRDIVENMDVTWTPIADLPRFIPVDQIYPPVLDALNSQLATA